MNVFILNTGRCGSMTFIRACKHISNYSSAHESRTMLIGEAHFKFPPNHIEADNRLSWFLGRLDRAFGDDAFYVHLKRNDADTARSFVKRYNIDLGIINAYRKSMLLYLSNDVSPLDVALDYCDTVNSNIGLFLKNRTNKMEFSIENAKEDFRRFWKRIGAQGDLAAALAEWDVMYNASRDGVMRQAPQRSVMNRIGSKLMRVVKGLPSFIANA